MKYKLESVKIYWGRNTTSYLYGSTLKLLENRKIFFHHELLPPGVILQEWQMKTNYQADRRTPQLPLLERGKDYQLVGKMDVYPEKSIYIRIHYYNRYEEEIGFDVLKSDEYTFTYPEQAFYYKIQLVNAGCEELLFHYLELSPAQEKKEFLDQIHFPIEDAGYTVLFSEPRLNQSHQITATECLYLHNVLLVPFEEFEEFVDVEELIKKLKQYFDREKVNQISFLGYGPLTNFIAPYIASYFPDSMAYVTSAHAKDEWYTRYLTTGTDQSEVQSVLAKAKHHRIKRYDFYVDQQLPDESFFSSLIRYENSLLRFALQPHQKETGEEG